MVSSFLKIGVAGLLGAAAGGMLLWHRTKILLDESEAFAALMKGKYELMAGWLSLKREGKSVDSYFKANGYGRIAIYGWWGVGEQLFGDLQKSGIPLEYVIDKRTLSLEGISCYLPTDDLPEADVVVITEPLQFDEMYRNIRDRFQGDIVSIEDVIYGQM